MVCRGHRLKVVLRDRRHSRPLAPTRYVGATQTVSPRMHNNELHTPVKKFDRNRPSDGEIMVENIPGYGVGRRFTPIYVARVNVTSIRLISCDGL